MFTKPLLTPDLIAQVVFIAAIAMMAFIYVGYPALMFALSFVFRRPVRRADITPRVSVIIAAYNEERDIAAKLKNTLALDYPRDRMEIIVASDCSTDRTDEIVRRFRKRGVILHRQPDRFGKTVAQHRAVKVSSGEILVFSDATTMYEPDALRKIVRSFADPEVGCVAGQLIYVDAAASAVGKGCRSYWGYEKFLKRCESQVGSLIGVSGCLYAVRRICHARLANDMIDDFVIATEIHLQGLRTVYEPEAIAMEDTNHRAKDEFRMRVRVIKQTMSALAPLSRGAQSVPAQNVRLSDDRAQDAALHSAFSVDRGARRQRIGQRLRRLAPVRLHRPIGSVRGRDYRLDRRTFEDQARAAGDPLLLRAGQRRVIRRLFESSVRQDLRRLGADS